MIKKYISSIPKLTWMISIIFSFMLFQFLILPAGGGEFPEKSIIVIVPYGPGGTDREVRVLGPMMSKILGQSMLIENREGGGGSIGTNYVVRSRSDGHILLFAAGTVLSLAPNLSELPYKLDDLIPLASTSFLPQIMSVNSTAPWKTIGELVDHAKKNPGAIKFGSAGTGSAVHLAGEAMALGAE